MGECLHWKMYGTRDPLAASSLGVLPAAVRYPGQAVLFQKGCKISLHRRAMTGSNFSGFDTPRNLGNMLSGVPPCKSPCIPPLSILSTSIDLPQPLDLWASSRPPLLKVIPHRDNRVSGVDLWEASHVPI